MSVIQCPEVSAFNFYLVFSCMSYSSHTCLSTLMIYSIECLSMLPCRNVKLVLERAKFFEELVKA